LPRGRKADSLLPQSHTGSSEANTTAIPCAFASSTIDSMWSAIMSVVPGTVKAAISFIPPWMTTTLGFKSITS